MGVIKLSDYVFKYLADYGVRHVFLVTGGGAMHLNDSLAREKRLHYICNHHEQACSIAAEGYSRVTGRIGVINVTTGPGGINALNGVFGAWTDSIPMLVISGQVKRETCLAMHNVPGLRQLGDQETDIINMVKGITKYAVFIKDPHSIRYHLERALSLATSGRPGPCWLDIPVDVQASMIETDDLRGYNSDEECSYAITPKLKEVCMDILNRLQAAKRPVIMSGTGVRLANAMEVFKTVSKKLGIPLAASWTTPDIVANDDPLYCGRAGTIGDRAGNFTVQNADVLLVLGSRLNIRQISYNWQSFARNAFKIQVDADLAELNKPTVRPDLPVHSDLLPFLQELDRQIDQRDYDPARHCAWLNWCRERVARYPVVLPHHRKTPIDLINPYHFVDVLFRHFADDEVVVCGNGTASVIPFQAGTIKNGQRMFANSGCASMGYDLPAAIGAAVAREGRRVICLAGDGSIQMNIQELQTLSHAQMADKNFRPKQRRLSFHSRHPELLFR